MSLTEYFELFQKELYKDEIGTHEIYNGFIDDDFYKTIVFLDDGCVPVGFCSDIRPKYSYKDYAFVFEDIATTERYWVHIPHHLFDKWKNQLKEDLKSSLGV